jgi:hypothetical protein
MTLTRRQRRWLIALASALLIGLADLDRPSPAPRRSPPHSPLRRRRHTLAAILSLRSPEYGVKPARLWDPWAAVRRDWHWCRTLASPGSNTGSLGLVCGGRGTRSLCVGGSDRLVDEAEQFGVALIFRVDAPPAWAIPTAEPGALPVDLTAFGDFCHALAARYAGRVRGYQVWNEPNLAREWHGLTPDPVGYVETAAGLLRGHQDGGSASPRHLRRIGPTGSGRRKRCPTRRTWKGCMARRRVIL